jgi:hypothetical protein
MGKFAVFGVIEENNWRPSRFATSTTVEKAGRNATEIFELAVAECVGERQHLEPAGHALNLGVKHEADAVHGFEHALRCIPAVLLVVVENEHRRENDQRQRGSRDQKSKTHWQ